MALRAGERLGPYEILGAVGAGGMGEVYRARDPRLGRTVAIKVLPASVSSDPARRPRFEHEARATGLLNHPNILAVHDVGDHEGAPYLVAELLEGETLRERLQAGTVPLRKAVDYALQVARGLAAAHDKGVIHRDLKPENLFVTNDGIVKILDFGLARQAVGGRRRTRTRRRWRGRRGPGSCWGRWRTCRRSRPGARRWTTAPICSRWDRCSTRCCRASVRSTATRRWRR